MNDAAFAVGIAVLIIGISAAIVAGVHYEIKSTNKTDLKKLSQLARMIVSKIRDPTLRHMWVICPNNITLRYHAVYGYINVATHTNAFRVTIKSIDENACISIENCLTEYDVQAITKESKWLSAILSEKDKKERTEKAISRLAIIAQEISRLTESQKG